MKKFVLTLTFTFFVASFSGAQYGYRWLLKPSGTLSNLYSAFVSFSSSNNYAGFACGSNGTFLVSTDGYNTWVSKSPGINVNLYSVIAAAPGYNSVICCGDNGTVLYTSNAGTSWVQMNSGTSAKLNSIAFYNSKLIAVGDGGVIITSTYSGGVYSPFTPLSSGTTQNLNSVSMNYDIVACGNNGTLIKSTNNGVNWFSVSVPTTQNLNNVINNSSIIIICGNNGTIFSTTNAGVNWTTGNSGVTNNLKSFNSENYILGSSGTVLYNQNYVTYPNIWQRVQVPASADLNSGFSRNYDNYYVFGSNGTILKREIDTAKMQLKIDANNLSTYMGYRGVFDQNLLSSNVPGFEWPIGSNKHVVFTTGLSASCIINGQLAQTSCSYKGEYFPGAIRNGQHNDSNIFRPYKVTRTDGPSSADWMNWGCMVPYGAPYVDVNHNGIYEPLIDTPGVKNAAQTLFICLTDINPVSHTSSEGYGGGITNPIMGIELHMTKWAYTYPSYNGVVFSKFEVLNKGNSAWTKTRFAFVSDPDVGDASDDWVGCDTVRNMGYAYNRDNDDQIYGAAPPAVGYKVLKGPVNKNIYPNVTYNMSSFTRFINCNADPYNECEPYYPYQAYILMQGYKSDTASWLDITQPTPWGSYKRSKKIFYGDPETNQGWTAAKSYIVNYGRDSVGYISNFENLRDKKFTLGMGADNYTVLNGDTAVIWLAQLVARGSSNLNSVTRLKELADLVQLFYESNFTIGVNRISTEVPAHYSLGQNYPNPFNNSSKFKFEISRLSKVKIIVYDITGRETKTLVNEFLKPGTYETVFDGSQLSSGVYFYRLTTDGFSETKRMVLLK